MSSRIEARARVARQQQQKPRGNNNNNTNLTNQSVRTVGDGTTAIAAFGDALNKSDFSDITFKVSYTATEGANSSHMNNISSSVSGKNYPLNNNNKKNNSTKEDPSTTSDPTSSSSPSASAAATTTIYAHRSILAARSPVFKQMFFGGFPESQQKEVSVVDEFKPEHFMTVLEWAYTGRADMSAKDVLGVLRCANFYGFDDLVLESRDLAQSFIDEENVLHLLEHAATLGESTLVYQCLNFIKCHAHSVLTSPVWLSVSPECVERVLQLPAIDCEEALLFEQALCWLETNTTLRADLVEADRRREKEEKQAARQRREEEQRQQQEANNNNNIQDEDENHQQQKDADDNGNQKNQDEADGDTKDKDEDDQKTEGENTTTNDDEDNNEDEEMDEEERERRAAEEALLEEASNAPYQSAPLVRRFFKHLRLSHLAVGHLLDRVRPLLAAHPSIRPDYVCALEFLVDPGRLSEVSQVPRAPTVLSTVQVDVPSEFLRGWRLVASIPQTSLSVNNAFGSGYASATQQVLTNHFFNSVPHHASYICVGEMVVGRDDVISIIAVGTVRMVRPIINSRSPVVSEEGDICWHASPTSFGFTPKQSSSSGSGVSTGNNSSSKSKNNASSGQYYDANSSSSSSLVSGMPGRSFNAAQQQQHPMARSSNQSSGVRFIVAASNQQQTHQQVYQQQQQQQAGGAGGSRDDLSSVGSISPNNNVISILNPNANSSNESSGNEIIRHE